MRSIFTSGVLDAFMEADHNPYDVYIGVSGGAMCLAYYLSGQAGHTKEIISHLSMDNRFISIWNSFREEGYVNLKYLEEYSQQHFKLDAAAAEKNAGKHYVAVVATDMSSGDPVYLKPMRGNWMDCLKATASLPFFTRGSTTISDMQLMDGGWSDPIPVRKAYELGARKITVIRTAPIDLRQDWTILGKVGSYYHRRNPGLSWRFDRDYEYYNESAEWALNPPEDCKVLQIAPNKTLKTKDYKATESSLKADYKLGLKMGKEYLRKHH